MVGIDKEFGRNRFQQFVFHLTHGFPRRQSGSVGDPENMRVDRHGRFTESGVEHHIRRFTADAGQCFQFSTDPWNLSAVALDQKFAGFEDIGGLGVVKAERADGFAQCR